MAITRAKVEDLLSTTIIKYGTSLRWGKFNKTSTQVQSGYDSLYEESITHYTNTTSGYTKVYHGDAVFSGYPIFSVTQEMLKANGYNTESVDLAVVTTDAFLGPVVAVNGGIAPNALRNDIITFSGVTYQIIGNKPFGYFNPDFVGHWIFCKYFEET